MGPPDVQTSYSEEEATGLLLLKVLPQNILVLKCLKDEKYWFFLKKIGKNEVRFKSFPLFTLLFVVMENKSSSKSIILKRCLWSHLHEVHIAWPPLITFFDPKFYKSFFTWHFCQAIHALHFIFTLWYIVWPPFLSFFQFERKAQRRTVTKCIKKFSITLIRRPS